MILNKLKYIIIIFFIKSALLCYSQTNEEVENEYFEEKIENIAENSTTDLDYNLLFENLTYYKKHPINLNYADANDLKELIFLNSLQIKNLIDYIHQNGKLVSIYELQAIEGFNKETILKIIPYVKVDSTINDKLNFKDIVNKGTHSFIICSQRTFEKQQGYLDSSYLGSPFRIFSRYNFKYSKYLNFVITCEKDQGEQFFKGTMKKGFDFYSAHLLIKNLEFIKTFVIGDYEAQFGQGLVLLSGMTFCKSPDVLNIIKNTIGIKQFTSSDANHFFRGSAITLHWKKLDFTAMYSTRKLDANIVLFDSLKSKVIEVSSIQTSGLHATKSQIADMNSLKENIYGTNLNFENKFFKIGITAVKSLFDAELIRTPQLYNQFEFDGKSNFVIGSDYSFSLRNFFIAGEIARSQNGGIAYLNSLLVSLNSKISFSILQRNYQRTFQNLYSNAFGENNTNSNEKGVYCGVLLEPFNKVMFSAYYDFYKFPWLRYQIDAPSSGYDYFMQIKYTISKNVEMYLYFKEQCKGVNTSQVEQVSFIEKCEKRNYRFNVVYQISQTLYLKNRVEFLNFKTESSNKTTGYILIQNISYHPLKKPYSTTFGFALFDADDYNTRMYAYENDVLYSYSIPACYNKGFRTYINLNYHIGRHFELWFRYSRTTYINQTTIGSGLDQINGNKKTDLKFQLNYKF